MNINTTFRTARQNFFHAINTIFGLEEKVTDENSDTYYTATERGKAHAIAKEKQMAAKAAKVSSAPVTICQTAPLRVRMSRSFPAFSIGLPVALLVIRAIVPEVAEELPHTYEFLDQVIIPMVEWLYAAAMNGVEALMQQEWFQEILQFLASFAA